MLRSISSVLTLTLVLSFGLVDRSSTARGSARSTAGQSTHSSASVARSANNKTPATRRTARLNKDAVVTCTPCAAEAAARRKNASRSGSKTAKKLRCHPDGYVDPSIARNYQNAIRDMKRAGIKPKVTSTWRSSEEQAKLHTCTNSRRCRLAHPGLYKALPPGRSLHEAGMAVDISGIAAGPRGDKQLTPRGLKMVRIMQKNGFKWRYGLADPAHFEADPTKHGYRTAVQAIKRSQSTCEVKLLAKARAAKKSVVPRRLAPPAKKIASQKRVPAGSRNRSRQNQT